MRRFSLQTLLLFAIGMLSFSAYGQQGFIMNNGTDNGCNGFFGDDGDTWNMGAVTGGPYSAASYVYTICPDVPGDVVQVQFTAFSIQQSPNPNNSDYLSVWDGDTASGLSLGQYTGGQLNGIEITGTVGNATGCLTFEFINNSGNPNALPGWGANVICTTPCAPPTMNSSITSPALPVPGLDSVSVCIGEEVTFSGNGSSAAIGFILDTYHWDFDDGTVDTTSGQTVTHAFTQAGEHIVNLTVLDNNGCSNLNVIPLKVVVSTLPDFTLIYPDTICLGESATLDGTAEGILWTSAPPFISAGETFLTDGAGFTFQSPIVVDIFDPGEILDDCDDMNPALNDLLQININMEHSYLGDLEMTIECPDGTQVILHEFGSGGGGTFLGEADDWSTDPGVGYDYGWSPFSDLGFLNDAANQSQVSYIANSSGQNVNNANVVNPGIYTPQFDLCDLVGCPLNGTWTFIVSDNLGIDDGWIFNWGLDFDPNLYPGITTFTPSYGPDSDSTFWADDPNFTAISADANVAEFTPPASGNYDFTYTAINNFGCVIDTVISIVVTEIDDVAAYPDVQINCGDPTQLGVDFVNVTPPPSSCDFVLELTDTWGDGWTGGELELIIDGTSSTYTLANGGFESINLNGIANGASLQVFYTAGISSFENEWQILLDGDVFLEDGQNFATPQEGLVFDGVFSCAPIGSVAYEFLWSPAASLDDPSLQYPTSTGLTSSTMFTVQVWEQGHPLCFKTDSMFLELNGALSAGPDLSNCAMSYELNGQSVGVGLWSCSNCFANELTFSDVNDPNAIVTSNTAGVFNVVWTDTQGLSCPNSDDLDIIFFDGISISETIMMPACYGECSGSVSVVGSGGQITPGLDYIYYWDGGLPGATDAERIDVCYGNINVILEDQEGCTDEATFFVDQPPAPVIDSLTVIRENCLDYCDGTIIIHSAVAETYSFDNQASFISENMNSEFCAGEHTVYIRDANGCEGEATGTVTSPVPPEANFTAEPAQASVLDPTFQLLNLSEGNVLNDWYFGLNGYSDEENPTHEFPSEPGLYNIELVVTDSIGCLDSLNLNVEVIDEFQIFIPTAFSPNADGINDNFDVMIQDLDPSNYKFEVYDRWGRVVYSSVEYPTRWNGESHEDYEYYVADGSYVWYINARSLTTTKRKEFTGVVTVVR